MTSIENIAAYIIASDMPITREKIYISKLWAAEFQNSNYASPYELHKAVDNCIIDIMCADK